MMSMARKDLQSEGIFMGLLSCLQMRAPRVDEDGAPRSQAGRLAGRQAANEGPPKSKRRRDGRVKTQDHQN